ncbi:MAG: hypothetical protein Kow0029_11890 [Candidatus Rifleibacteriota bacterium]
MTVLVIKIKEKFKKIGINSGKQGLILIALFWAATILGYLGESQAVNSVSFSSRKDVFAEMGLVLKRLGPLMNNGENSVMNVILDKDIPQEIFRTVKTGIVKNFPDGSWHLDDVITKGEAVTYFARLVDYIKQNLKYKQLTLEGNVYFEDVPSGHWLESDLKNLAGIGALNEERNPRFFPDNVMPAQELKKLSKKISDYFSSNILILSNEGSDLRIIAKGVTKDIDASLFEVSFDSKTWYAVPEDGVFRGLRENVQNLRLHIKHPHFLEMEGINIPPVRDSTIFVKLRRNYARYVKDNLMMLDRKEPLKDQTEILSIKKRLAQLIRSRNLHIDKKVVEIPKEDILSHVPKGKQVLKAEENSETQVALVNAAPQKDTVLFSEEKSTTAIAEPEKIEPKTLKFKSVNVTGTLRDALSGEPIANAMLLVDGKSQPVDASGRFSFYSELHKIVEITAYSEGYSVLKMKHRVGYKSSSVNITLKPQLTYFSGRVVSYSTAQPVSQALIRIGNKATRTSADGRFTIRGIRPGYHQLSCFARNFLEAHEIVFIEDSQTKEFVLEVRNEPTFSESNNSHNNHNDIEIAENSCNWEVAKDFSE